MQATPNRRHLTQALVDSAILLSASVPGHARPASQAMAEMQMSRRGLGRQLRVGDVVFIRIPIQPFTQVASTTSSWTNHVGIVIDVSGKEPLIAESRFPLSGQTTWTRFVKRSDRGRVAVSRLSVPLDQQQQIKLQHAVDERRHVFYDTGFDLHSGRQFCSRYVREVLQEAVGVELGEIEDFDTLLKRNPKANQRFWRVWYFGRIPWQRETVTPASLLRDSKMQPVFDGRAN
jgi:hypothetical protein